MHRWVLLVVAAIALLLMAFKLTSAGRDTTNAVLLKLAWKQA